MKLEACRRGAQARERSAPRGLQGDDAHHCDSPASAAMLSVLLGALLMWPTTRAYKDNGNPGGGRLYHGLNTSC